MEDPLREEDGVEVAVIGMAGRFPGALNLDAFWENLRRGVESITFFSDEELSHVSADRLQKPNYVRAGGVVDGIDLFDATFFGFTPREAALMDPQHRIFLELCWETLEQAGYDPDTHGAALGVFAGAGPNTYLHRLLADPDLVASAGEYQLSIANGVDHLTPRVSYLLNLGGPSVPVQTACSTSLVAVHMACQSLIGYECDMALAGGCSLPVPAKNGYLYLEDGIMSPDGRCRAFDRKARGTVRGGGAGLVFLKRLSEAIADRDHIHAVIAGSAVNNDGGAKVGYTAPGVNGQRRVIEEALGAAGVDPQSISYVEAHGTGTSLGDPIEIEALSRAFATSGKRQYCALGSVKTNIGHADAASGIAGLLKTILCLEHKTLVPTLHFEEPNPGIPFQESPFYVNTRTAPWDRPVRIAGVSSFGIGGTNAHVIVREAPELPAVDGTSRPWQLVTLSAKTVTALQEKCAQLRAFLADHADPCLPDLAFTLHTGRKDMTHRRTLVCRDFAGVRAGLARPFNAVAANRTPSVVFLLPGQGKNYPDLGGDLYRHEPVFREEVDRCSSILEPVLGLKWVDYLFAESDTDRGKRLRQPDLWQPALFTATYAAARLWMSWGIQPRAMIGHSIGEYVAATLAGVFSLEAGLTLVARRGKAAAAAAPGAMLAVFLDEAEVADYVREPIALAAVNGPRLSILSGPVAAIEALARTLKEKKIRTLRLDADRAYHSSMMDPAGPLLTRLAASFERHPPIIPFLSNVTGTWMSEENATDPGYWAVHLCRPVRFNDCLQTVAAEPEQIFLEVGPGNVLTSLVKNHPANHAMSLTALGNKEKVFGVNQALTMLGELWKLGLEIDWPAFYREENRSRLALPTYPFERKSFWIDPGKATLQPVADPLETKLGAEHWFYHPFWKPVPLISDRRLKDLADASEIWLVLMDEQGFGEGLAGRLDALPGRVIRVRRGHDLSEEKGEALVVDPEDPKGFTRLLERMAAGNRAPTRIIHCWGSEGPALASDGPTAGYDGLIRMAGAMSEAGLSCAVTVLTVGMQAVWDEESGNPELATLVGAVRVIPTEVVGVTCKSIDLGGAEPYTGLLDQVLAELILDPPERVVAYRGRTRLVEAHEKIRTSRTLPKAPWPETGTFLIVHGLREIGFQLAEHLLGRTRAQVILLDLTFFPEPEEWETWIREQGERDPISQKIKRLQTMATNRIRVVTTNPADNNAMRALVEAHGPTNGVFFLDPDIEGSLIQAKSSDKPSAVLASRMAELRNLEHFFHHSEFLVLFSENPGEGGIGHAEQAAIYEFTDHYAHALAGRSRSHVLCIDWGTRHWEPEVATPDPMQMQILEKRRRFGMSPREAIQAMEAMLAWKLSRVILSTRPYDAVLEQQRQFTAAYFQEHLRSLTGSGSSQPRPSLSCPYAEPVTETERALADQWQHYFGIDKIGIHDSFFELGGHSLLAVQMLNKTREQFAVEITIQQLFEAPTIADLAPIIDADETGMDEEALLQLLNQIEDLTEEETRAAVEAEANRP